MIIAFPKRFSIEQVVLVLKLCLGIVLGLYLLFVSWSLAKKNVWINAESMQVGMEFALDKVFEGPLALKENGRSALEVGLEQKLVFLAQSVRPDRKGDERVFRIGCRGAGGEQVVHEGEAIACSLVEHPSGGLESITLGEGEVSLVPQVLDGRSLLLKVERAAKEAMEIVLQAASPQVNGGDALAEAKWLGRDLFFQEYGEDVYRELATKEQVEVGGQYVLYVGPGDFLSLREGRWHNVGRLEEADYDAPLAQVLSTSGEMEIEAWDEKGFPLFYTKLKKERVAPFQFQPEQVVSGAKLRTANQITCKMGKKRFSLQPGDWVVFSRENARKLRGSDEIEAFLDHRIRGELVVVDRIDGVGRVTGKVFDDSRTQSRSFVIQSVTSKNNKRKK